MDTEKNKKNKETILLMLMPIWDPLIPPLGIASLKRFLTGHGCKVKTVDANVEEQFRQIYHQYFDILKQQVPAEKQGNFYNIGHEVLRNHMMAHLNYNNHHESQYNQLVRELIYKTFYVEVGVDVIAPLKDNIRVFYERLEIYLFQWLEKETPDVVGLSVYTGTLPASLFAFKLVKRFDPGIRTVMGGGIFASDLAPDSPDFEPFIENTPYIDAVIVGEGEHLFLELLQGRLPASQRVYTLADSQMGPVNLSTLEIPDFSDFSLYHYPLTAAYTSRGCPFHCAFCSEKVLWGTYRKKNPGKVVRELIQLYKQTNSQLFLMCDSLLNPIIMDLAGQLLQLDIPLYWDGYLRADRMVGNIDNTFLWRQAGFYRARLGLESGSPGVLEAMGKKITPQQITAAISSLARAGIKTTTMWVIGFPGETEEDFRQTLDLIEEYKDNIYEVDCNPFAFYPTGQINSRQWQEANRVFSLYSNDGDGILPVRTWVLDARPSREEVYHRLSRFMEHIRKLGIPNPYTLHDIYTADERWQKLHENAVPPLVAFKDRKSDINECRHIKKRVPAQKKLDDDDNFGF